MANHSSSLPLCALLLAAATACGGSQMPRHIVLISIDTLRADHLGCYGNDAPVSPAIDGLARAGALFERVQAPRGLTWPSLTSLLTGKYPITHGVHGNGVQPADDETMLMHDLKAAGYATGAFISNCGRAFSPPEKRGLDVLVATQHSARGQDGEDRNAADAAMRWLDEHHQERSFTWLHLMNPHRPYSVTPGTEPLLTRYEGWARDGVSLSRVARTAAARARGERLEHALTGRYPPGHETYRSMIAAQGDKLKLDQVLDLVTLAEIDLTPADLGYICSRYDAEIRGSDTLVGEILAKLDALGIADETLVIFTADHGEELFDHNYYFFHSSSIYQSVLHVPLILRWPGHVSVTRVARLVENIDVLPTVLELADLPRRDGLEGESLLPLLRDPAVDRESRFAVAELWTNPERDGDASRTIYSVRDHRWKLIVNPTGLHPRGMPHSALPGAGFRIEREELYDLDNDRGEQADLLRATVAADPRASNLATALYLARAYAARNRLQTALTDWLARHPNESVRAPVTMAEDERAELAALGYVDAAPLTEEQAEAPTILATIHDLAERVAAAPNAPAEAWLLLAAAASWSDDGERAKSLLERARAAASAADRSSLEALARELGF